MEMGKVKFLTRLKRFTVSTRTNKKEKKKKKKTTSVELRRKRKVGDEKEVRKREVGYLVDSSSFLFLFLTSSKDPNPKLSREKHRERKSLLFCNLIPLDSLFIFPFLCVPISSNLWFSLFLLFRCRFQLFQIWTICLKVCSFENQDK